MKGDPAPIYADAFSLCEWLLGRLDGHAQLLARQICEDALAVLESVGLALKRRSVGGYLRYMDDFSLFGDDRGSLLSARSAISDWLLLHRGLTLGRKRWEVFDTREPTRFVGYRVSRAGVSPGRKVKRRLKKRLRAAAERGPDSLARSIASYRGVFLF